MSAAKIKEWQAKQRDFVNQTGLKRQYSREQVGIVGKKPASGKLAEYIGDKSTVANLKYIEGNEYRNAFTGLFSKSKLDGEVCKESRRTIKINSGTTNENYALVFGDGTKTVTGKAGNYGGNIDLGCLYGKKYGVAVLTHNHPLSTSFSADDISLLINNPQISAIVAAGHNGSVYRLRIGAGARNIDRNIYTEYNKLKEYYDGNIESVITALAKRYGWRYTSK